MNSIPIPIGCTRLSDNTVIDREYYIVGRLRNGRFESAAVISRHPAWQQLKADREAQQRRNEAAEQSRPATKDEMLFIFGFWPDGDNEVIDG